MQRSRRKADAYARRVLKESGTVVTDADVLEALRLWRFKKNKTRKNVMREGLDWVYSDTLGVVRSRDGRLVLTRPTREHPDFMRLLCTWIRSTRPFPNTFPFTSISLNSKYGAKAHRDGGNAGRIRK